jgi:hypothetical protein
VSRTTFLSLALITDKYGAKSRHQRAAPHLGKVDLASRLDGEIPRRGKVSFHILAARTG